MVPAYITVSLLTRIIKALTLPLIFSLIVGIVVACDRDSTYIVSSGKPQYNHSGEIVDGIDMRAEVALLSRNILIYGEMESSCYGKMCQFYSHDTFGGHVKVCSVYNFM